MRGQPLEHVAVDVKGVQVACVHADHPGPGVRGTGDLLDGVALHHRGQAQRLGSLDQGDEGLLVEGRDDQQRQVGTVRARLPQLVARDDEVLAQDGDVDGPAYGDEVLDAAREATRFGEHADHGGAAGLVVAGERGWVGDGGELALGGTGPLHLRDHRDALAAQRWKRVVARRSGSGQRLQLVEADPFLACCEVDAHIPQDVVEHAHATGPLVAPCHRDRVTVDRNGVARRARRVGARAPATRRTAGCGPPRTRRRGRPAPRAKPQAAAARGRLRSMSAASTAAR